MLFVALSCGMMNCLWKLEFCELALQTWRACMSGIVIENINSDNDEIQYFSYFPFVLENDRGYGVSSSDLSFWRGNVFMERSSFYLLGFVCKLVHLEIRSVIRTLLCLEC